MICKKCKTAVSENDKKCLSCGASLKLYTNHRFWLAALVFLLVMIIIALYIMNTQMRVNTPYASENQTQTTPPFEMPSSDIPAESSGSLENNGEATQQQTPFFSEDPAKPVSEIEQIVKNAALTAEKYRNTYSETNEFVSKNGFLFDFPAEMYISTKDLEDVEGFNTAYANENIMFLYIKAGDMPDSLSSGLDTGKLTVFAAMPSSDSFIISNGDKTSAVTGSVMQEVLDRYNTDHSPVEYVSSESKTFTDVLAAFQNNPGLEGQLDIRYMAEDDKYVSAVISKRDSPLLIKEFVLQKTGNTCEIMIDNIEKNWQKFVAINTAAPDVNLDLIPAYNLWRDMRDLKSDFSGLLKSMLSSGVITQEEGEPVFISGNGEFVFMEFADGVRMLAHNDEGRNDWKVYQVLRYEDAVLRMKDIAKFNPPPYFLIKQYEN